MKRSTVYAAVLALSSLSLGCTMKYVVRLNPDLDSVSRQGGGEQAACIGVLYSSELQQYTHKQALGADWQVVSLGEASTAMFDRLFTQVCRQAVKVSGIPPYKSAEGVEMIIEPRIEAFQLHYWWQKAMEEYGVTYRIIYYTPEGVPVMSQIIVGKGQGGKNWKQQINENLVDAATKFLGGFGDSLARFKGSQPWTTIAEELAGRQADQKTLLIADARPVSDLEPLKGYIPKSGIVALKVSLKNNSQQSFIVRGSDMHLVLSDGTRIVPACATSVISRLEEAKHTEAVIAQALTPFYGLPLMVQQAKDRVAQVKSLTEQQMGDRILGPDTAVEAFVFFVPASGVPNFDECNLAIWFLNPESLTAIRREIRVEGINFRKVRFGQQAK
jgi:hypothetical protein